MQESALGNEEEQLVSLLLSKGAAESALADDMGRLKVQEEVGILLAPPTCHLFLHHLCYANPQLWNATSVLHGSPGPHLCCTLDCDLQRMTAGHKIMGCVLLLAPAPFAPSYIACTSLPASFLPVCRS